MINSAIISFFIGLILVLFILIGTGYLRKIIKYAKTPYGYAVCVFSGGVFVMLYLKLCVFIFYYNGFNFISYPKF